MGDHKFSFHERGKLYSPAWMSPEGQLFCLFQTLFIFIGICTVKSTRPAIFIYLHLFIQYIKIRYTCCMKGWQRSVYRWLSITRSSRDHDKTSRDRGVREIWNKSSDHKFLYFTGTGSTFHKIMQSVLTLSLTLQLWQVKYLISK
jgi:hypothetical protein